MASISAQIEIERIAWQTSVVSAGLMEDNVLDTG
jgi:hypothetical protein